MASNITVKDAARANVVVKTTEAGGVHTPHHNIDAIIPGTGATDLGKAEDGASAGSDVGVASMAVRDDDLSTLTPIEGDYTWLRVDSTGALWARISAGSGATDLGKAVDDAAGSTDTGIAFLGVRDDALGGLTPTEGDYVRARFDANGALWTHDNVLAAIVSGSEAQVDVVAALPSGTNVIGYVGLEPRTSGGPSSYRDIDLDETGISIKGSAGQVYTVTLINTGAGALYVKLYDKATAPTVGTDTPAMTIQIPAGGDRNLNFDHGFPFSNGIGIGCTTGVADNDTGAPGANEMIAHVLYK